MLAKPIDFVGIASMLAMTIEITGRLWGHKITRVFTALSVGISFAVWAMAKAHENALINTGTVYNFLLQLG